MVQLSLNSNHKFPIGGDQWLTAENKKQLFPPNFELVVCCGSQRSDKDIHLKLCDSDVMFCFELSLRIKSPLFSQRPSLLPAYAWPLLDELCTLTNYQSCHPSGSQLKF